MPSHRVNPDFQMQKAALRAEWDRMMASPVGLARPLVVLSGWRAPGFPGRALAERLRILAGGESGSSAGVCFTFCNHIGAAIDRALATVEARWPSPDPDQTVEIDAVGISMGGLVARAAAMPGPSRKRLRLRTLFTLGTPHRGARIARLIAPDPCVRDMKPGSGFLAQLDAALPALPYELVCYARLRDSWVGASNSAPAGHFPIWKPGPIVLSHHTMSSDPLIATDIARRLRGEPPLAVRTSPPPRE